MKYFRILILFLAHTILWISPSFAGITVDTEATLACDEIFHPEDICGAGAGGEWESLRRETGIVVNPFTDEVQPLIKENFQIVQVSGVEVPEPKPFEPASVDTNAETGPGDTTSNAGNTPFGGQPPGGQQNNGGAVGPAAQLPPTKVGGGGPEVREGLIFASEEPEAITPPKASSRNVTADLPKSPSAVDLNKDNDTGSDNAGSAIAGAGFGGGGAAGQVGPKGESGPGVAGKKPRGDSFLDNLAKIAKNMGRRFFGASGPGLNGQGQGGTKFAYRGKGKKGSGTQMASANTDGLDLQGAYGSRMPASNFEFNGASMWMYGNMCDHWKELSKQDRIPRNYAKCPQ